MTRILITGCSSGLGRVAALRLAAAGHQVTAILRRSEDAASLLVDAAGRDLSVLVMDLTDADAVAAGFEELRGAGGVPDVLVNNAGAPCLGSMEELNVEDLKAALELNVIAVLRLYQAVAPAMRARGAGQIINVSSALGVAALPVYGGYCATKFALEAMSEAMRYELAPFGISVNLLQPGLIDTPFAGKKAVQRSIRVPDDSPYRDRLDRPSYSGLGDFVSSAAAVSEVLLQMIAAPKVRFRWVCGQDSENWLAARRALDDEAFETYATELGYGAPPTKG